MRVFLFSRLRTRLLVHRLAVAAGRRDPSARTAGLLDQAGPAVAAVPAASRAGPGADRATGRQLAGPSRSAPAPAPAPDAAGLTGART